MVDPACRCHAERDDRHDPAGRRHDHPCLAVDRGDSTRRAVIVAVTVEGSGPLLSTLGAVALIVVSPPAFPAGGWVTRPG
jgi:hypothetical protein